VFDSAALRARLGGVRDRIARAASRVGRDPASVRLIAVSKTFSADHIRAAADVGQVDFGENKVQEALPKMDATSDLPLTWHLIGHLQRNKLRRTLPLVALIHSVDSERLLAAIDEEWQSLSTTQNRQLSPIRVLLEVNTSGEAAKHGIAPAEVEPVLAAATQFPSVEICGLMTMAALEGGLDAAARNFAALRALADRFQLKERSMGMSGDFEVAIREGATIVRVGTALWE